MTWRSLLTAGLGSLLVSACAGGASLDGTSWVLQSLGGQGVLTGSVITLSFSGDTARGSGGCNEYFGEYETDGSSVTFGPLASTQKACGGALDQQEVAYLSALQSAEMYEVTGDRLEISYPAGVLTFTASEG